VDKYAYSYNFNGQVKNVCHRQRHRYDLKEGTISEYDHAGRLKKTKHYIGSDSAAVTTSANTYNELGQLSTKIYGNSLETQTYKYNLRGWLTEINGSMFSEKLYYERNSTGIGFYNGNIKESSCKHLTGNTHVAGWKANTSQWKENWGSYTYTYDLLNRMTLAAPGNTNAFREYIYYDKHGNIANFYRSGIMDHGWGTDGMTPSHTTGLIDFLSYQYNGNQLTQVTDAYTTDRQLFTGGQEFKNRSDSAYLYDNNGNMSANLDKNISTIRYNTINLPDTVQMRNGDMSVYAYDTQTSAKTYSYYKTSTGSVVTIPIGVIRERFSYSQTQSSYFDNVVYEGISKKKILTTDGMVTSNQNSSPVYTRHYMLKDHLGNVRVVFDENGTIKQVNNYTPFGVEYGESAEDQTELTYQDYQYSGKEFNRKFELNMYDFGARNYDAAVGRWTTMDPLAGKYYSISPYAYCANNPVNFLDTDGRKISNSKRYVLSNRTLMDQLAKFDQAVSEISSFDRSSYTFEITGGDRYRKNGLVYSATNNKLIPESAGSSSHLREIGASGIDLKFSKMIPYEVIKAAANAVGMRLDPGGRYKDNHFHLDLKNYKGAFIYEGSNYIPSDDDFVGALRVELKEVIVTAKRTTKINQLDIIDKGIVKENQFGNTGLYDKKEGRISDQFYSDQFNKAYYDTDKKNENQ